MGPPGEFDLDLDLDFRFQLKPGPSLHAQILLIISLHGYCLISAFASHGFDSVREFQRELRLNPHAACRDDELTHSPPKIGLLSRFYPSSLQCVLTNIPPRPPTPVRRRILRIESLSVANHRHFQKLFVSNNQPPNDAFNGCTLVGIPLSGDRNLANLGMTCRFLKRPSLTSIGSILLAFISILVSLVLIWRSDRKQAAVGRRYVVSACSRRMQQILMRIYREMQLFLLGFVIIEICEIFTVGGFPLDDNVRKVRLFRNLC